MSNQMPNFSDFTFIIKAYYLQKTFDILVSMVTQWCGRQLSECSDIDQEPWGLKQKGQIYYNYYNGIEMQTNTYITCILCFTKCINLYKYNIPIGK